MSRLLRICSGFGLLVALPLWAASPSSGTLSPDQPQQSYTSGPFVVSNASGIATGTPTCQDPALPCDDYALTVQLPADYQATHPDDKIVITTAWSNTAEDYDLYLYDANGSVVGQSASSNDPEVITIPAGQGAATYTVRIVPFTAAGGTPNTTIALVTPATPPPQPQPSGVAPRFKVNVSPPGLGEDSGEPSLGYSLKSKRAFYQAVLETLKVTFPEQIQDPVDPTENLPAACDATWQDVSDSPTETTESLDPILFTEPKSGRTFVSQLLAVTSAFAFTDDDGATYTQGQVGPPNGGVDHQSVGAGPYPAGSPFAQIAQAAGVDYAVYYCSQSIVAAFCARSDDGGLTFGNGVPIYSYADCGLGALHGHVRVAPDGTVYVPDKSCNNKAVVSVSKDAGVTWTVKPVPDSSPGDTDPSIGISTADPATGISTAYLCYVGADGHPRVAVTRDEGDHWTDSYDLGQSAGVVQAVFPEAIAGDPDRAACAFVGTSTTGNYQSLDFEGVWYGYVAMTYDGGQSWFTVNVTPNDPIQGYGGICTGGTTCGSNRNLLDFNDINLDEFGRVMAAFSDGCVGACVQDPSKNSFASKSTIVRQSGGRTLYAANDDSGPYNSASPVAPQAACLAGTRYSDGAHLSWKAPDNGGTDITGYRIYRGTSLGAIGSTPIATVANKTSYDDASADPTVADYFYKVVAVNAQGDGAASNPVDLKVTTPPPVETPCTVPGVTVVTDPAGDASPPIGAYDILSVAVAEPPALDGKLVFTLKVADLSTLPPDSYWFILTQDANGKPLYLSMDTSTGAPAYTYGSYQDVSAGVLVFNQLGTLDAASTYSADGSIVLVADKQSVFGGLKPGDVIASIQARTRAGASSTTSRDFTGSGSYTLRAANACIVLAPPVASLAADPQAGVAPLTVNFDASASTTPNQGATIASYTFDFGDGSAKLTQSSPKVAHTYQNAGNYPASLTVTDSSGQTSANPAQKVIEVSAAGNGTPTPRNTAAGSAGGGAAGFGLLLPLTALAALRRRRR